MAKVRALDNSADRFVSRAAAAISDYVDGAVAAATDWHRITAASEANYAAGVQSAIANKSFSAAVQKVGPEKYATAIAEKGAARFGPGVAAARDTWAAAFSPFHSALTTLVYPPRKPRRDPANLQRVNAVVAAMIKVAQAQK